MIAGTPATPIVPHPTPNRSVALHALSLPDGGYGELAKCCVAREQGAIGVLGLRSEHAIERVAMVSLKLSGPSAVRAVNRQGRCTKSPDRVVPLVGESRGGDRNEAGQGDETPCSHVL